MCPRCISVFDEEVEKKMEGTTRYDPRRGRRGSQDGRFTLNNIGVPLINEEYRRQFKQPYQRIFHPPPNMPKNKWVKPLNHKGETSPNGNRSTPR